MMRNGIIRSAVALACALLGAQTASGQVAVQDRSAGASSLEEVIVTARKQNENIMGVPLSISAVTGETLAQYGIGDLHHVDRKVPNLYLSRNATQSIVGIRGFASYATNFSIDSAIGLSLDEVALSSTRWLESAQFDLQQIEVLRGPQGTYFGKNTTAGLLNITTRGPTDHLEGYLRVGYEDALNERVVEGAVGGPIGDRFGARLAVRYLRSNGFVSNIASGDDEPSTESFIGRLSLVWRPADNIDVSYKLQREQSDTDGALHEVTACSPSFGNANASFGTGEDCNYNSRNAVAASIAGFTVPFGQNRFDLESWLHALRADVDFYEYTLSSVTGYSDQRIDNRLNPTWSGLRYFNLTRPDDQNKQFSQEIRLQSPNTWPVHFIVGAYYADVDFHTTDVQGYDTTGLVAGGFLPAPFNGRFNRYKLFDQNNESWALFTEVTWDVTDSFHVIAGGRYTDDRKSATISQRVGSMENPFDANPQGSTLGFSTFTGADRRGTTDFSPAATLQYDLGDGQLYASYKEGFKSGGFDASLPSAALLATGFEFDDETAESYEIGIKLPLLNGRLRFTGALYRTTFTDLQLTALIPPTTSVLTNAGGARAEGVEIEVSWAPGGGFDIYANLGTAKTEYTTWTNAPCWTGQSAALGCINSRQDNSGKQLGFAPRYTGSVGANWEGDVAENLKLGLGVDANYRSHYDLDIDYDPLVHQDATVLVDARMSFAAGDDAWSVSLVGRNLFEEDYSVGSADVPFFARSMSRVHGLPRTVQFLLEVAF